MMMSTLAPFVNLDLSLADFDELGFKKHDISKARNFLERIKTNSIKIERKKQRNPSF